MNSVGLISWSGRRSIINIQSHGIMGDVKCTYCTARRRGAWNPRRKTAGQRILTKGRIACRAVVEDLIILFAACRY